MDIFYLSSTALIKLSIIVTILRFKGNEARWRWGLRLFGVVIVSMAIVSACIDNLRCRPFSAIWNAEAARTHCWPSYVYLRWMKAITCRYMEDTWTSPAENG